MSQTIRSERDVDKWWIVIMTTDSDARQRAGHCSNVEATPFLSLIGELQARRDLVRHLHLLLAG
jgi:hypothetical protein